LATRLQVTCIRKRGNHDDPHERIQGIGGGRALLRWYRTEDEAIRLIKTGTYNYYVIVGGREADVVVATHNDREYLKTRPDGYAPNNLLALPECP
jgi:hypothetical protein